MNQGSYFVYILGNGKGTLYAGITNDLVRRMMEHKEKKLPGFTRKYNVDQLLYSQEFSSIHDALEAEKQIKGWTRKRTGVDPYAEPKVRRSEQRLVRAVTSPRMDASRRPLCRLAQHDIIIEGLAASERVQNANVILSQQAACCLRPRRIHPYVRPRVELGRN